jgi:hypothetical protein
MTGPEPAHAAGRDVAAELDALRADVDDLVATVGLLLDEKPAGAPSRWSWRHADRETAAELWAELDDFVGWVNTRYLLPERLAVKPCWYRHPAAVEELTALMAAWRAAYHGSDRPRDDMAAWHDRWLWPTLQRLEQHAGWRNCTRAHEHPSYAPAVTDDGFAEHVADDLATRPRRLDRAERVIG